VTSETLLDHVIANEPSDVEALAGRALLFLKVGRADECIDHLLKALRDVSAPCVLTTLLAQAYEHRGDVALAEQHYSSCLEEPGREADNALVFAGFLLRHGRSAQAEEMLETMRDRHGDDPRILGVLAQLKLNRHEWQDAREIAQALANRGESGRSMGIAVAAAALKGSRRHDEAIALLLAERERSATGGDVAAIVAAYLDAGAPQAAEELLSSVIASEPTNERAHILLGSAHYSQGKNDLAEAAIARAIDVSPDVVDGYMALAKLHLANGNTAAAKLAARAGLTRRGNKTTLFLLLASALEGEGDFDGAMAVYEQMLEADPYSTIAANNLASLLVEVRRDATSLQRAYELAIRFKDSDLPHFLDTLGWILHLRGDDIRAVSFLSDAAEALPEAGSVQYHLGMTLKSLKRFESAFVALERAVALADRAQEYLPRAEAALAEIRGGRHAPVKRASAGRRSFRLAFWQRRGPAEQHSRYN